MQLSDIWGLLRLSSMLRLLHNGAGALRNAVGAVVSRPLSIAQVPRSEARLHLHAHEQLLWLSRGLACNADTVKAA